MMALVDALFVLIERNPGRIGIKTTTMVRRVNSLDKTQPEAQIPANLRN